VAHKITDIAGDNSLLLPMAEAALEALGHPESLHVVADAGYSNDEQAEACEAQGIVPHVPVTRAVNNQGDGTLFDRNEFHYDEKTDTFRCPANQTLTRKQLSRKDRAVYYAAKPEVCGACALKMRCTNRRQRLVSRHLHEDAFQRMQQRATPEMMRLRRSTVEHPFASLKYHIFGHAGFRLKHLLNSVVGLRRRRHLRQFFAIHDQLDLVGIEHFALQQCSRNANQRIPVLAQDTLGRVIALSDQPPYFVIDLDGSSFAIVAVLRDLASQEDLLFLLAECQRPQIAHAKLANHLARQFG